VTQLFKAYSVRLAAAVRREDGQALVEYALILFLVALACVLALTALGAKVASLLQGVVNAF
jgi:Flp pilus assembly pilin Flp